MVRSNLADTEREFSDDMIHKVYGIGLGVLFVDLQRPDARSVVDGRVLETAHFLALFADESQKLNIHLDVMTWNLLLIALGVDLAHACAARKTAQSMPA